MILFVNLGINKNMPYVILIIKKMLYLIQQVLRGGKLWKFPKCYSCGYLLLYSVLLSTVLDITHIIAIKIKVICVSITKSTGEKLQLNGGTSMMGRNVAILEQGRFLTNNLRCENLSLLYSWECQLSQH